MQKAVVMGIALLVISSVAGLYLWNRLRPEPLPALKIKKENIVTAVTVTGEVRADETIDISPPLQGRIVKIYVEEGDWVNPGDLLVRLNEGEARGRLIEAQGQLKQAQAQLEYQLQGTRQEELRRLEAAVRESADAVRQAESSLNSSQAQLEEARLNASRMNKLFQQEFISTQEYDAAQTRLKTATHQAAQMQAALSAAQSQKRQIQAQLDQARHGPTRPEVEEARGRAIAASGSLASAKNLVANRILRSPREGIIIQKRQAAGEIAEPGKPILKMADPDTIEVIAFVEEADLGQIRNGQKAYVVLDSRPDTAIPATVHQVGQMVNTENGTVETKIRLDAVYLQKESRQALLPGMTADINIMTGKYPDAIVVPTTAVGKKDGKTIVYRFENNQLQLQPVRARRISSEQYLILEGLQPGEWITRIANPEFLKKERDITPKPEEVL